MIDFNSFLSYQFCCFKTSFILVLEHVDFKIMMSLKEAQFILKSPHSLLWVQLLFLSLKVKSFLQIPVLFLQNFKDGLFVLEFGLEVLRDELKLFDIALHVL